jgi:hypothetical protein
MSSAEAVAERRAQRFPALRQLSALEAAVATTPGNMYVYTALACSLA